jgi:hypothetical protein
LAVWTAANLKNDKLTFFLVFLLFTVLVLLFPGFFEVSVVLFVLSSKVFKTVFLRPRPK